jgi:hypothetical protein
MMTHDSEKCITLEVYDKVGGAYDILLTVKEKEASGTLVVTPKDGHDTRRHVLTQIKKSQDGKVFACKAGMAMATLTIDDRKIPSTLHLVATVFFPVIDTTYTLSQTEQQRLVAWIHTLALETLNG